MGCVFTKEINEEVEKELSKSSQLSLSELSYIEPIKTQKQIEIEKIQFIFSNEYKKNILLYR